MTIKPKVKQKKRSLKDQVEELKNYPFVNDIQLLSRDRVKVSLKGFKTDYFDRKFGVGPVNIKDFDFEIDFNGITGHFDGGDGRDRNKTVFKGIADTTVSYVPKEKRFVKATFQYSGTLCWGPTKHFIKECVKDRDLMSLVLFMNTYCQQYPYYLEPKTKKKILDNSKSLHRGWHPHPEDIDRGWSDVDSYAEAKIVDIPGNNAIRHLENSDGEDEELYDPIND